MADEAETQAVEETQQLPVEETAADSATDTQTEEQTSETTQADSNDEAGKAEEAKLDASSGDKKQSESQDSNEDSKPVSRRSAAYRIQELVKENKALKQQQKSVDVDDWDDPQVDDKPDIADLVAKEVEKRLNPVISESSKTADDAEINELFSKTAADRTKYEGQIRKLWNLPQYKDVAAQDIYNMLRGKEMDQTLAQARQQAVEEFKKAGLEAKESSASGSSTSSNRTGKTGEKSAWDLPEKEFNQAIAKARTTG